MFGWLGAQWRILRARPVDVGNGLRPDSRASALSLFLVLVLGAVALILLALGFDLSRAARAIL